MKSVPFRMGTSRYPAGSASEGLPMATVTHPEFGASCDRGIPSGEVLMLIPRASCSFWQMQSLRIHISDQCFEWSWAFRNCLVSSFEPIHVSRARSLLKPRPRVAINSQLWVQRFVNWLSPRHFAECARRKIDVARFFQLFTNGTRHAYLMQQE